MKEVGEEGLEPGYGPGYPLGSVPSEGSCLVSQMPAF